ncbi:hypothetical protein NK718_16370 [Alsobacter sp. SYSU M60028]|uniref:Phenylacetate--CoA ligase family protein n=1 Tax=Alsobacter ponti TaxID=2962936 RepID=A0ABT1LGU7_9HYPH|nr:hypothetical protein [Alsobacter ponti]MCP8940103.1 hypothetical protein [Alsobacter ponti]
MVDFSRFPLRPNAFSERPLNIVKPEDKAAFALLMELVLLETGSRAAREAWQKAQLANVLGHAQKRSRFWAARIGPGKASAVKLRKLPEQTRAEVLAQVKGEGPLLTRADGVATKAHFTSGSSGQPVTFHVSEANAIYNEIRSFAQYLMEDRDLRANWVRLKPAPPMPAPGYKITRADNFAGRLGGLFAAGKATFIDFSTRDLGEVMRLVKSCQPGYLIVPPRYIEMFIEQAGLDYLKSLPLKLLIGIAEGVPEELRKTCESIGVTFVSTYSCEEVGVVGAQCRTQPDCFHVATSNVIVEESDDKVEVDGKALGRLLVTHLHGYATPFIRYDVGDLGTIQESCPCGHDGPVVTNLFGRLLSSVKRRDGTRASLYVRGQEMQRVHPLREFRIRQTALDLIEMDVVSDEPTPEGALKLADYVRAVAGEEFRVEARFVDAIDWGPSPKRLAFRCEV